MVEKMAWLRRPVDRGWVAVAVLGGVLISLLPLYWQLPLNVDRGAYAAVAHLWLDGVVPYRDVVDFNTPGVAALYAAAFAIFGESLGAIALLDLLWRLGTLAAVFGCGRVLLGRAAGIWAAVSYVVLSTYPFSDVNGYASKEGFAVLPMVLAAWALWRYRVTRKLGYVWLAGVGLGLAALLKPTFAAAAVALAVTLVAWWRADRSLKLWSGLLVGAVGCLAAWLPFVGYLVSRGALGQMVEQVGRIGGGLYIGAPTSFGPYTANVGLVFLAILPWIITFGSSVWAWAGAAVLVRRPTRPQAWLLLPLGVALCLAVVWQRKLFIYHWGAVLGPLALLAGFGASRGVSYISTRLRVPRKLAAAATLISLLVPLWYAQLPQALRATLAYRHGQVGYARYADELHFGYDTGSIEATAARIKPSCRSGATLQVWGNASSLYWRSGCQPATRFIYDVPLTVQASGASLASYQQQLRAEFLSDLRAAPATFFVVLTGDGGRWEGRSGTDKLLELPELAATLAASYQLEQSLPGYDLYRHVGAQPNAGSGMVE